MSTLGTIAGGTEAEIGREIIRLVPHWYEAECGPAEYSIPIGEHRARFFNHCRLTPHLQAFLAKISARTREMPLRYFTEMPGLIDVLLESFTMEWLRLHSAATNWTKVIGYFDAIASRTHENTPVTLNLIIRPGSGIGDITQPYLQKFLDRLASSPFSYLAVDAELRLMDYGEVDWNAVRTSPSYKFHPEFLHPIYCVMEEQDLSAHLTSLGSLVLMNRAGLLAARRKGKWRVYDVRTFKNSLSYCLGNYHVGANLFEVLFDLSFRRQGALLVYDPEHRLGEHLLNRESILLDEWNGQEGAALAQPPGQSLIRRSIEDIGIGRKAGSLKRKRRLIEMACVDGAIVFDDHRILAVGAIIKSHPNVGNQLGARMTAARSAYLWGGRPITVSSDGDVTVIFTSRDGQRQCEATMHFL
jgi:hypothetical protein